MIQLSGPTKLGEDPQRREIRLALIDCPNCGKEIAVYVTQGPHFEVQTAVGRVIRVWAIAFNGDKASISPSIDLSDLKDHKCHVTITNVPFKYNGEL